MNLNYLFADKYEIVFFDEKNDSLSASSVCVEGDGEYQYVYSTPIDVDVALNAKGNDFSFYFDCDGKDDICGGVVYLDERNVKIGSVVKNCNQIFDCQLPSDTKSIVLCLRLIHGKSIKVNCFLVGKKIDVHSFVNKLSSFDSKAVTANISMFQNRKIIIETIFCDTEVREHALRKYFSYFATQIYLMSRQTEKNFIWVIHISSDKQIYIHKISSLLSDYNLHSNVFINVFDHPVDGYNNENETHIDRRCRPNASYPERREYLFEQFLMKFRVVDLQKGNLIARVATDDDDFMLPNYISAINLLISKYYNDIEENECVCLGLGRNYVTTYRTNGSVFVEDVSLTKLIPGMKFICSNKRLPRSPFGLPEDFKIERDKGNLYIDDHSLPPCYMYNRHGANFSNGQKNIYYSKRFNEYYFDGHAKIIDFMLA